MTLSLLRSLWQRLRSPRGFVGRDLEGNRYFEYPNPQGAIGRTKRVVTYRKGFDMWTYIAGERRLPVQWTSWLTHTRPHPPTLEELHADIARQNRVRIKAALIEARDRQVSLRVDEPQVQGALFRPVHTQTAGSQPIETNTNQNGSKPASTPGGLEPVNSHLGVGAPSSAQQPHTTPSHTADGPQSWTPRTTRRAAN